jgi:SAM-dependent methyltransferase
MATQTYEVPAGARCHACGSANLTAFFDLTGVPVNSCLMVDSREEALRFPTGDLRLAFCKDCGFIFNLLFNVESITYSAAYEETQGCSPRFNEFARSLAQRLIDDYGIRGKHVLEIGCGKGEFLAMICELGGNTGTGIDPAYVPGRLSEHAQSRIEFITDFYSEKYSHLTGDVVCCRHTLEHIAPVREFVQMVRRSIGDRHDTLVFFEVPDVSRVLRENAFWDIYYEHCTYFSLGSLGRLFRACGFEILKLYKDFDDQYLLLEARPSPRADQAPVRAEEDIATLAAEVTEFQGSIQRKFAQMKSDLEGLVRSGQKVVVWGSGSKAVAYLSTLKIRDEIEYIVDINPVKHGKFLAGTGHEIVAPEFLQSYRPDVVILMNPIYYDEVQRHLDSMGVPARLTAV